MAQSLKLLIKNLNQQQKKQPDSIRTAIISLLRRELWNIEHGGAPKLTNMQVSRPKLNKIQKKSNEPDTLYFLLTLHTIWVFLMAKGYKQCENAARSLSTAAKNQPIILKSSKKSPANSHSLYENQYVLDALKREPETRDIYHDAAALDDFFEARNDKVFGIMYCHKCYVNADINTPKRLKIQSKYVFANQPIQRHSIWIIDKIFSFQKPVTIKDLSGNTFLLPITNPEIIQEISDYTKKNKKC